MRRTQLESTRSYNVRFFLEVNTKMYVPSKYKQVWVQLTMRITVRIILEAFTYNTKIVRRQLGSLLYRVTFALSSSEMLHARMTYTVRTTRIQHVSCATKTITTRFQCT